MYIAMNRFQIVKGKEDQFVEIWRSRESNLKEVPGFNEFHLLCGPEGEGYTLYATHVIWDSEQHFRDWTTSENFRKAHAKAGSSKEIYMGPPRFEGFNTVLTEAISS